ncbi:hypothetical protein F5884DRAFT_852962 [Xylogone sp. PMI_703]|nr:hypothetical protein F5884DRAFT_852962 [Xylogone sp. PMI_703]
MGYVKSVKKEPDESWTPANKNYITLAVEVGVSESERGSTLDARPWLEHTESHVAQVVTIRIGRRQPEVRVSIWELRPGQGANQQPAVTEVQRVNISLVDERPVANGTITLSFEKLLERRPRPGMAEKNLVLSARELGELAQIVWKVMRFIQTDE